MVILRGALEAISQALFWLVALLVPAMALIVTYEVVVRYAFGRPTIWVTEIASYMLVAVAFLGASWTLKCGGHIRMDLLIEIGGPRLRATSDIAMFAVATLVSAALAWTGWNMAIANYNFGWNASTLLSTPLWIPQMLIPVGSAMLLVQSLIGLADAVSGRASKEEGTV